jgi:hypothetical protein
MSNPSRTASPAATSPTAAAPAGTASVQPGHPSEPYGAPSPGLMRSAGWLAIVHSLMFLIPLTVLGAAIGWPANLDMPASHNLPLVLSESFNVKLGYSVYLLYSILFWPTVLLVSRAISGRDGASVLLQLATGFALVSTLARSLGIIRWLSVMPVLATQYSSADASLQASISVVYEAFNAYAGRIGEVLGVFLFSAISLWLLSVALWRAAYPKWLSVLGMLTASGLSLLSLELFGLDMGTWIAPFSVLYMVWMVCLGVVLIRRAKA